MKLRYSRQFYCSIIVIACFLAGCAAWDRPLPLPAELSDSAVQARLRIGANLQDSLDERAGKLSGRPDTSETPDLKSGFKSEPAALSLADAVDFAKRHSPRLRSARAAIERSGGKEQAAFAAFLPEATLGALYGATTSNESPGAPGPTGFLFPLGQGVHSYRYYQQTLTVVWTLYDFGGRSGRFNQAVALKQMAELQLVRADQTVQFDAAVAYLNILISDN